MENLVSIEDLTTEQIASICDHTFLLRPEQFIPEAEKIEETCIDLREAAFNDFLQETVEKQEKIPYAICIRPEDVEFSSGILEKFCTEKEIIIVSVVGFPHGSSYSTDLKAAEAKVSLMHGAKEIDMVLNYRELQEKNFDNVKKDIDEVKKQLDKRNILKLILETSELLPEEIRTACKIADECGVDFVKTSTGFGKYGARKEDLEIMKEYFPRGIKISGKVNVENYKSLLNAASREGNGLIDLDPRKIRIGESSLLKKL